MPRNGNANYKDASLQEEYFPTEDVLLEDVDDDDDDEAFDDDDDDEAFDDDDDDETYAESVENDPEFLGTLLSGGLNKIIPKVAGAIRRKPRTGRGRRFSKGAKSIRNFSIRTPAGRAQLRLPASVVTKKSFKSALARVGKDIRKNGKAIKTLDKNYKMVVSSQSKAIEKKLASVKTMSMMNLFMQPKLKSFEFKDTFPTDVDTEVKIKDVKYTDNNMMMMMMMMGDNGFGGDSSSSMMMAMMMSGFFDKDDDK